MSFRVTYLQNFEIYQSFMESLQSWTILDSLEYLIIYPPTVTTDKKQKSTGKPMVRVRM